MVLNATPEIVGLLAVVSVALLVPSLARATMRARTRDRQAGSVRSGLLIVLLGLTGLGMLTCAASGCASAQDSGARMVGGFVDCMAPSVAPVVAEFGPAMREVVTGAITNAGKFDRDKLKSTASSLKTPAGQCVLASAFAEVLRTVTKAVSPDAPQSAGLELDVGDAVLTFEELRPGLGGAVFRTRSGVL